jgi:hypothetical protein
MALAITTEWDVRTTGSDSNAGGWDSSSSGTDYSQQDSPQVTYADLVIGGTTTQLTSAGNPFTSAHVGNVLNVTGGTGFTTGRYQVVSVASNVATMDRSVGTAASTGGAGKLGGALATPSPAFGATYANTTTQFKVHVKAGTYTATASYTTMLSTATPILIGYQTTHNDGGTRPLFTTATSSLNMFIGPNAIRTITYQNINFSDTSTTRGVLHSQSGGATYHDVKFVDCMIDGFAYAVNGSNVGAYFAMNSATFKNTEVKSCTTGGCYMWGSVIVDASYFHDNTGDALKLNGNFSNSVLFVRRSVFYASTGKHINGTSASTVYGLHLEGNDFRGATSDGVFLASGFLQIPSLRGFNTHVGNIYWGNGGYGFNGGESIVFTINDDNAYGSNTSGARNNLAVGTNDKALTASPWVSTTDFSLNTTSGGGPVVSAAETPGPFLATTTGAPNIGAVPLAD